MTLNLEALHMAASGLSEFKYLSKKFRGVNSDSNGGMFFSLIFFFLF